jgi:hypothetical protein
MERKDVVILVNSTPKYYYILDFMFGMLHRYAKELAWDCVFATEMPEHPVCISLKTKYNIIILSLKKVDKGFLDSRRASLSQLVSRYKYCLPLQDDFILEKGLDANALKAVLERFDNDKHLVSARLMPCPGPLESIIGDTDWAPIGRNDEYKFVFQATLWKTEACLEWYKCICDLLERYAPKEVSSDADRTQIEVRGNIAENSIGQAEFWKWTNKNMYIHIAWIRKGSWSNAVYLSPFPYRPTAIVRGALENWAQELAKREGFTVYCQS